jgi:Asp-tRNA(Asn)/Glu-tRNA(Gln) amidotransferase A subunit family amidase
MASRDLAFTSAVDLARMIAERTVSPVELVSNSLARIEEVNPSLNCFCFVWHDDALAAARSALDQVDRGAPLGPLHGIPVALKDTTPTAGHRTTLGSYTHEDWVPDKDAFIVRALRRAGAIIVGKTTTPEFAHTLLTDSPLWGATRNPWNLERTPGGSSGGSAAAVAAGCVPLAEGTDMGGSVRIPAAWCGIVGLKPGLGRIPMDTLPGLFDLLSHHGPLARTVDDARLFLRATQGPDDADILSVACPLDLDPPILASVDGMRLGLSIDLGCWAVDPDIEIAVRKAADALGRAGATIEEVDLRLTARDNDVWLDLWSVFMATYYGEFVHQFREKMDPEVVQLVERGNRMSAMQHKRLELARTDLWRRIAAVLSGHDAILCPTMAQRPSPAAKADQPRHGPRGDDRYHGADMTGVFNLVSPCPALSVPCGWDSEGMPIGLQIVGRRWREDTVLRIGRAVELAIPDALRRPPI